jgi:ATP-binding cassette, subfamily B, bacterial MsbA
MPREASTNGGAGDAGREAPLPRAELTRRVLGYVLRHRVAVACAFGAMILAGLTETAPIFLAKVFVTDILLPTPGVMTGDLDKTKGTDLLIETESGPVLFNRSKTDAEAFVQASDEAARKVERKPRVSWAQGTARKMIRVFPEGLDAKTAILVLVVGLILVTSLLAALATYANEYLAKALATNVVVDVRTEMMRKLLRLPLGYFTRRKLGDIQSRFSTDAQQTHLCVNLFVSEVLLQPIVIASGITAAFVINWRLAIAALFFCPLVVIPVIRLGRKVTHRSKKALESVSDSTEAVSQALSGIRIIKAFGMEGEQASDYRALNEEYRKRSLRITHTKAKGRAIVEITYGVVLSIALGFGGWLVMHDAWEVEAGDFVAFLVALVTLFRPLKRLTVAYHHWNESLAGAKRLFEIIDTPSESVDRAGAHVLGPIRDSVRFEDVSFAYPDVADQRVLDRVTFTIPAGTTVALVGPSGAGKSTIADLLLRFYEPVRGRITIDGHELSDFTRESLLAQIAVVSQQPFLFNTTVAENIRCARPAASREQIVAAAKAAHVDEFASKLTDGYDTVVGERGASLSGGQLQRITIARAILKNASLLILDEATSNLDTVSEGLVQEALANLSRGRTALVIAHRLSTIEHADLILVMERGRMIESGTHQELLARKGAYFKLYSSELSPAPS